MNAGIPDEIQVEKVLQIEAGRFPVLPQLDMETIELAEHRTFAAALSNIARHQIARAFGNLKSHLHSHGSLRKRPHQSFEQPLDPVPRLIAGVVRLNAPDLETCYEGPIDLHGHVVQQIPDTELLAQWGRAPGLFVPFDRQRHQ